MSLIDITDSTVTLYRAAMSRAVEVHENVTVNLCQSIWEVMMSCQEREADLKGLSEQLQAVGLFVFFQLQIHVKFQKNVS